MLVVVGPFHNVAFVHSHLFLCIVYLMRYILFQKKGDARNNQASPHL